MSAEDIFLTVVYIAYIASPLLPDELWLRLALAATSFGFVIWGLWIGNEIVILANGLFLVLSMHQVIKLLRQRQPVELTQDQDLVHAALFPSMTSRQFVLFWHLGEEFFANPSEPLIEEGKSIDYVYAVVDGEVDVVLPSGNRRRPTPTLLGEMSYIRGVDAEASADVLCVGEVRGRRWPKSRLYGLNETHGELTEPFLRSLGADLASKVRP